VTFVTRFLRRLPHAPSGIVTVIIGMGKSLEGKVVSLAGAVADHLSTAPTNWPRLFGALILDAHGSRGESVALVAAARRAARKGRYAVQLLWSELVLAELHRETAPAIALRCLAQALAESERMDRRPVSFEHYSLPLD
jgi:hypothetical protein